MKEEILKRAMFAMPLSKKAQGTGIMAGFDMEEMEEDVDENADMEEMPPMARTPQNPEILMNTLRGDMRSVDARYQELADMVGEEAAMETPPEVLAMLQSQFGAQQQGIGALPQGQEMMPPGAGMPPDPGMMPPPDQMGAPQPAPAMPQGGIPMPPGMESAPPFSQGAEAPEGYAVGGLVRGAQFLGDKVGQYGAAANAALGRMFMSPQMSQPVLSSTASTAVPFGNFGSTLVKPGMAVKGGELLTPTFTQGISTAIAQGAERFPRAAQTLRTMFPPLAGLTTGMTAAQSYLNSQSSPLSPEEEASRQQLLSQIPTTGYPAAPMRPGEPPRPVMPAVAPPPVAPAAAPSVAAAAAPSVAAADKVNVDVTLEKDAAYIKPQVKDIADFIKENTTKKSKIDRIRDARSEYEPLFAEILGDDKESAKINALLLLSEAGLKLASTAKPTFAMALADAASGLPRGFAAIAAQERELGVKGKVAALQQAIGDVETEDKYQQALGLKRLENQQKAGLKILEIDLKALDDAKKKNAVTYNYLGAGLVEIKNKESGQRIGLEINQNDPVVQEIRNNPLLVNNFSQTGSGSDSRMLSPYARDLGKATTVTRVDTKAREEALERFNRLSSQIGVIDGALNVVDNAFSPESFFSNAANNIIVPLVPNFILRPDLDQANTIAILNRAFADLTRGDAQIGGKLSVQGEKWMRDALAQIGGPANFLKNPEIAAKVFNQRKTDYMNELYRTGTELGLFDRNIEVTTPPTGTRNDPFILPENSKDRAALGDYLRSIFGSVSNQKATVYFRDSKGTTGMPIEKILNPRPEN